MPEEHRLYLQRVETMGNEDIRLPICVRKGTVSIASRRDSLVPREFGLI